MRSLRREMDGLARDAMVEHGPVGNTAAAQASARTRITRLALTDFRSYAALSLVTDAPLVALSGENGAGKTNILESISLFTPGRGLRRADLGQMLRHGASGFTVFAALDRGPDEPVLNCGVGLQPDPEGGRAARICRIDGDTVSSPAAFAEYLRLVWLTPDLDALFCGPAGDRRRFLDRLVLAVDSGHGSRVAALERATRSRNRLLEEGARDPRWLDAVEREIAELGIAVAVARAETVTRLAALIARARDDASPFPDAGLALEAEDAYRERLRSERGRDRAAGRTLFGPQASDLLVRHAPKDIPAGLASTGEQKALLIGLVLAHAALVRSMTGHAPIVLLDEVAAHLDTMRRAALYRLLAAIGGQVWMTGADPALFADLPDGSLHLAVADGAARPIR